MGIDIVKLLEGAAAMSERFAVSPPGENPSLDFGGLLHLLSRRTENLGFRIESATAALALLAKNIQHPRRRNDLLVQWIPADVRHDRLSVAMPTEPGSADRSKRKDRPLIEIAAQHTQEKRDIRYAAGQHTIVVQLGAVDEASIGQLIQFHFLAGAVKNGLACDGSSPGEAGTNFSL